MELSDVLESFLVRNRTYFFQKGRKEFKEVFEKYKQEIQEKLSRILEFYKERLSEGLVESSSLENDEEKQIEVEVLQIQQLQISIPEAKPCKEEMWDFSLLFNDDFLIKVQNLILFPIESYLKGINDFESFEGLHWSKDIFVTANFKENVTLVKSYHTDEFLKPCNAFLLVRKKQHSFLILISRKEAHEINEILLKTEQESVTLMFLDDIDGATRVPFGEKNKILNLKERKLVLITKLFNRECHFENSDREIVSLLVDKINTLFRSEINSEKLYTDLMKKGLINSYRFLNSSEFSLLGESEEMKGIVRNKLKLIVEEDMIFDLRRMSCSQLKQCLKTIVKIRGKLKDFKNSILEDILDK